VSYSPGGKWLLAADSGLRVWEAATAEEKKLADVERLRPGWAIFTDDHNVLAVDQNGTLRVWNLDSGHQRALFKHYASRLAYSAKARLLAVASSGRRVELFDYPLPELIQKDKERIPALLTRLDDDSYPIREAATADLLALGIGAEPALRSTMKETPSVEVRIRCRRLLEAITVKPRAKLAGNTGDVEGLAFSPDGQFFAAGGRGGAVCLWSLKDFKEVARLVPASP
jgi:WD40 repeat protein